MCLFALQLMSMQACSLVAKGFCIPCHSACIASRFGLLLVDLTVQPKSSLLIQILWTERFASASDYSKGENITPAKAQLQTIIRREQQRVGLDVLQHLSSCGR